MDRLSKSVIAIGAAAALLCGWLYGSSNNRVKKARETMAKLIDELEVLANNVQSEQDMQRTTMRATVLGAKLLGEILDAVKDGARKTQTAVDGVSVRFDAIDEGMRRDDSWKDLQRNIQRIADAVAPVTKAEDPWSIPKNLHWAFDPTLPVNRRWSVVSGDGYFHVGEDGKVEHAGNLNIDPDFYPIISALVLARNEQEPEGPK